MIDEFKSLLRMRVGTYDEKRIIDQPTSTARQLLSQLAATDVVVATRFHNVLLASLLNKPVISISFHHKCALGLSRYCHDINHLDGEKLIKNFVDLENNAEKLKPMIRQKVEQSASASASVSRRRSAGSSPSPVGEDPVPRYRPRRLSLHLRCRGLQSRPLAEAPCQGAGMTAIGNHALIGRWRIVEAEPWDRNDLDLVSGRGGSNVAPEIECTRAEDVLKAQRQPSSTAC